MKNLIKEMEKEFDKKFVITSSSGCEYFRRESGLNASEEATIIPQLKSFIFHDYTEKMVEGIVKKLKE